MATEFSSLYGDILPEVAGCPKPTVDKAIRDTLRDFCYFTQVWKERLTPISTIAIEYETDIAFVSGPQCTITSTTTDFDAAGFSSGDEIVTNQVSDDPDAKNNSGPYTIDSVVASTITLVSTDSLVSVAAGDSITISKCAHELSSANGDIVKVSNAKFDGVDIRPMSEEWLHSNVENWRTELSTYPNYYTVDVKTKLMRLAYVPSDAISDVLEVWAILKPPTTGTTMEDFIYEEYNQAIAFGALSRLQKKVGMPWFNYDAAIMNSNFYMESRNRAKREGFDGLTFSWVNTEA